jgi:type IV pilus assembly protein PilB
MRKKLGAMLVESGLISEVQLNAALNDQHSWGGRLGTHLVKMGILSEDELVAFLARQMEVPRFDFRKSRVFKDALALLPRRICDKHGVIPVAFKDVKGKKELMLAMADPTNLEALSEVEFLTGATVRPVVAPESDVTTAIHYCYSPEGLRDSDGLAKVLGATRGAASRQEDVIIFSGGEERVMPTGEEPMNFGVVRAILELLFEKNVITPEEFHRKMDRIDRERR